MPRCATFDLTAECPLRCRHCYFFSEHQARAALSDETWLARLAEVVETERLHTAFWVGGEPLLELGRLRRAASLFARNAVATSGAVPIPPDLGMGLLVSLDGLEPEHDRLRGRGAFARALAHLAPLPARSFVLNVTLTRETLDAVDQVPQLVERTRAAGAVVGFFTARPGAPLALDDDQRERAVERLLALAERHPGALLTPPAALEFLRPGSGPGALCPYRGSDLAFDPLLRLRRPCTFGASADCGRCGCPVVGLRVAMEQGDGASRALLTALFARAPAAVRA